jgi:hypothetical protein
LFGRPAHRSDGISRAREVAPLRGNFMVNKGKKRITASEFHEGEITVETLPDGGWRFLHPDGRHFEVIRRTHTPRYDADDLEHTHAELGIHIDSDTAATRWRGERMDYEIGVWVLCNQANRARRKNGVSAETSAAARRATDSG